MTETSRTYNRDLLAGLFDRLAQKFPPDCEGQFRETGLMGRLIRCCLANLELEPDDVFLDAGTGPGTAVLYAAQRCRLAIGIDISRVALDRARQCAARLGISNATFAYGALEEPSLEFGLGRHGINKILIMRSLSHLPDSLKRTSLEKFSELIQRPGRLVIGDIIFFEAPEKHRDRWDEVHYDGGLTDYPACSGFLASALEALGARARVQKLHPLLGAMTADFVV